MRIFKGIMLLILFFLVGCQKPEVIQTIDVGKVVKVEIIPGDFFSSAKTSITTESAIVIVPWIRSVLLGREATIVIYDNGYRFLCIEGETDCWGIIR